MRQGEVIHVNCPGDLDKGGNINQYEHFGDAWIHTYSDMLYEIEMVECAYKPLTLREEHGWGAKDGVELKPYKHFKLVAQSKNKKK